MLAARPRLLLYWLPAPGVYRSLLTASDFPGILPPAAMIVFPCHVCRTQLSAEDAQSGQLVRCPTCLTTLRVPAAAPAAQPAAAMAGVGAASGSAAGSGSAGG